MHVDLSVHYREKVEEASSQAIIAYTNASLDQESQIHSILHQWNMSNGGHTHCNSYIVHHAIESGMLIAESKVQFFVLLSQLFSDW